MGNKINNNFDPRFNAPLDGRVVVADYAERDALVTNNLAYEGMIVYTKDNGADLAVMEQYVNVGTVALPDLQWAALGGGGGATSVHNDLLSIQGGLSNTEHYHLTKRQHDWVVDSVPFVEPTLILTTNGQTTWGYGVDMGPSEPIILNSAIALGEASNVYVRIYDIDGGAFLVPDGGGQDGEGYVSIITDGNLNYTFPTLVYPVDTSNPAGSSHAYRTDMKYQDLEGLNKTKTDSFTYYSNAQFIDEIWISKNGYDIKFDPAIDPPALALLNIMTAAEAQISAPLSSSTYPTNFVVVVSDDLTGGDSSRIQIKQNGTVVFQDGVAGGTSWTVGAYTGDTSASPANPAMTYIQLFPAAGVNTTQEYQIFIV